MLPIESMLSTRGVRLVAKAGCWHQRAIDRALRLLSLGRMSRYLTSYVTTIGRTIYVPADWERWSLAAREDILRHELVHVAQFDRLGPPLMALLYLFVPLPVGLAYFRARFEKEAYTETLRCAFERGGRAEAEALRASILRSFTGPDYLWMWPYPEALDRWFTSTLDQLAETRV